MWIPFTDVLYASADERHASTRSSEADDGQADPENALRQLAAPHLQHELSRLLDCTELRAREATLRVQSNWEQLERFRL